MLYLDAISLKLVPRNNSKKYLGTLFCPILRVCDRVCAAPDNYSYLYSFYIYLSTCGITSDTSLNNNSVYIYVDRSKLALFSMLKDDFESIYPTT